MKNSNRYLKLYKIATRFQKYANELVEETFKNNMSVFEFYKLLDESGDFDSLDMDEKDSSYYINLYKMWNDTNHFISIENTKSGFVTDDTSIEVAQNYTSPAKYGSLEELLSDLLNPQLQYRKMY